MKAVIKFYGIKCKAKINDTDFELIGKNEFTQLLLDIYLLLVFMLIQMSNFFLRLFNANEIRALKIGIIEELKDSENKVE